MWGIPTEHDNAEARATVWDKGYGNGRDARGARPRETVNEMTTVCNLLT